MHVDGSVYDTSVEFDGTVDVYRVFFSAFEKRDLEVRLNICTRELIKNKFW